MHKEIRNTEPTALWNHFADLNAIPRPSKKEECIVAFMVDFGKKLGLETQVDGIQNVLIKKPATKGFENKKTVVLQSHLDMVHQKNNATQFDFESEGIKMNITDGWIHALGTTLGADNGIGVAAIMAVLSSTTLEHPAIEALFTVDEETGMTGAMELQPGFLSGDILLNLDTEDDDEISIGCAGGIDITGATEYPEIKNSREVSFEISISGLNGGHSGMDIHKGLGNANKLLNRVLLQLESDINFNLVSFQGGNLRNAIPREAKAGISLDLSEIQKFDNSFADIIATLTKEFQIQEKNLKIAAVKIDNPQLCMSPDFQKTLLRTIAAIHNGVFSMNAKIPELVETSNNLARITVSKGNLEIACLTRSFSESGKTNLVNSIQSVFELAGFNSKISGDYPGWEPNPNTEICSILQSTYKQLFHEEPNTMACHAGLECGILGTHYPTMEMISFGPTIRGAHSPDEKVNIKSTEKFWKFFLEILKRIPNK
ncbi:aminoacyl-histidine dipeptidase [Flavicella sp.]|uniref:aminoacyl-histidine dipeptidase n=1 Tax=Flavicella sp. TaxID=2957742 RepID=UPI00260344B7|nr:aminoacyl-histidine dipeptidase [Flavicella sp.]MDG1803722.1 aminoacyl-histidine dipeptidase [Flavicella sp.]